MDAVLVQYLRAPSDVFNVGKLSVWMHWWYDTSFAATMVLQDDMIVVVLGNEKILEA